VGLPELYYALEASFEVTFAATTQLGKASERIAIGERTGIGSIVGSMG